MVQQPLHAFQDMGRTSACRAFAATASVRPATRYSIQCCWRIGPELFVVIYKVDRLSRSLLDFARIINHDRKCMVQTKAC